VSARHAPAQRGSNDRTRAIQSLLWGLCIAVVALCFLEPSAVAASEPAHAPAAGSALSPPPHGDLRFSWTPSLTEPYAVCGRPTASRSQCLAIIVPVSARRSSSSTAQPALTTTSPSFSGSGVGGGYDPADLRSAYDLPSESAGSGQTVAIVDAYDDPKAESDLAVYRARYGIPACTTANGCFRKVNQTGGATYPTANAEWSVETSLDLDMVSAACPNCHILLVEASNDITTNLDAAEDEAATLGATEISNSWGSSEYSGESGEDPFFDHPGVPVTAAAGDSGYGVEYPAASPDVIAVGGTALTRASNTRGWSETAWSGTGSGCSAYEPKPAWQTDKGCADRTDNDVAAVASTETPVSVADSYKLPHEFSVPEAGWTLVAGTSVASPLVAGTMALANAYTRSFPGAEALYEEAAQNGAGVLDNVLSGSNGSCGTYLCEAGPGYNGPTGLGSLYGAPVVQPPVQQEPQGAWVGKYGAAGYLLADWDGVQDLSDLPNVTATLVKGSRYEWAANTSDVRALQSPAGTTRAASAYYSPTEIKLQLSFSAAYSGDLHLYAVDWDSTARRESITVNDGSGPSTVALSSEFHNGAWITIPITVAAAGSVSIAVTREAGPNAVLSGIFLGNEGSPPAMPVTKEPQGGWVGAYGSAGYDLAGWEGSAGDLSSLPNASVSLAQGSRYEWAANTTEARALESPEGLTRRATTYFNSTQVRANLSFSAAFSGTLHLYALDWDTTARRETITVDGQTATLSSSFHEGAWVSFPITVAAGGTVTITVDKTVGANAVLSGIFLD
jgi:Subtilase family